jgi:hypothetical protein
MWRWYDAVGISSPRRNSRYHSIKLSCLRRRPWVSLRSCSAFCCCSSGKRWSGRSWKDKFSSSLTRKAVAPLSLSIKCLVLLRISFRIFASVSENRILICAFKCSSATGLRGRIEEEDETKTEKASDRTISEAWYKREPICSSSRTIVGADFLDGFCNWIVSI